jgi:hypothetical protein
MDDEGLDIPIFLRELLLECKRHELGFLAGVAHPSFGEGEYMFFRHYSSKHNSPRFRYLCELITHPRDITDAVARLLVDSATDPNGAYPAEYTIPRAHGDEAFVKAMEERLAALQSRLEEDESGEWQVVAVLEYTHKNRRKQPYYAVAQTCDFTRHYPVMNIIPYLIHFGVANSALLNLATDLKDDQGRRFFDAESCEEAAVPAFMLMKELVDIKN